MSSGKDSKPLDGLSLDDLGGLDDLALGDLDLPGIGLNNEDDPLKAVDYDAPPEEACAQEMSETLKAFKARAQAEQKRFELATDSEYWCAICFQTREQKEAFLAAVGVLKQGDKYIDGQVFARKLGIEIPKADVPYNVSSRVDRKLIELT